MSDCSIFHWRKADPSESFSTDPNTPLVFSTISNNSPALRRPTGLAVNDADELMYISCWGNGSVMEVDLRSPAKGIDLENSGTPEPNKTTGRITALVRDVNPRSTVPFGPPELTAWPNKAVEEATPTSRGGAAGLVFDPARSVLYINDYSHHALRAIDVPRRTSRPTTPIKTSDGKSAPAAATTTTTGDSKSGPAAGGGSGDGDESSPETNPKTRVALSSIRTIFGDHNSVLGVPASVVDGDSSVARLRSPNALMFSISLEPGQSHIISATKADASMEALNAKEMPPQVRTGSSNDGDAPPRKPQASPARPITLTAQSVPETHLFVSETAENGDLRHIRIPHPAPALGGRPSAKSDVPLPSIRTIASGHMFGGGVFDPVSNRVFITTSTAIVAIDVRTGVASLFAGAAAASGFVDGYQSAKAVRFHRPVGLAFDESIAVRRQYLLAHPPPIEEWEDRVIQPNDVKLPKEMERRRQEGVARYIPSIWSLFRLVVTDLTNECLRIVTMPCQFEQLRDALTAAGVEYGQSGARFLLPDLILLVTGFYGFDPLVSTLNGDWKVDSWTSDRTDGPAESRLTFGPNGVTIHPTTGVIFFSEPDMNSVRALHPRCADCRRKRQDASDRQKAEAEAKAKAAEQKKAAEAAAEKAAADAIAAGAPMASARVQTVRVHPPHAPPTASAKRAP